LGLAKANILLASWACSFASKDICPQLLRPTPSICLFILLVRRTVCFLSNFVISNFFY